MLAIGIDLGSVSAGWAALNAEDGSRYGSGAWHFAGEHGHRWAALQTSLIALLGIPAAAGAIVAYERVRRHNGTLAAHAYGGSLAVLELTLERMHLPAPIPVDVQEIKRLATRRGNAKKELVQAAANIRWERPCTLDEADALWVAECARLRTRRAA